MELLLPDLNLESITEEFLIETISLQAETIFSLRETLSSEKGDFPNMTLELLENLTQYVLRCKVFFHTFELEELIPICTEVLESLEKFKKSF